MHRLFTHLITRLFLKDLIIRQEQAPADAVVEPNFHEVLALYIDGDTGHRMLCDVLAHNAATMGYVAEIASGKWVYMGE